MDSEKYQRFTKDESTFIQILWKSQCHIFHSSWKTPQDNISQQKFSPSDQTLDCMDPYGLQSTLAIFGKINFANSQHQIMNNGSSLDSSLLLYSK